MIDGELDQSARSPARAELLQSPGHKPWVNRRNTFLSPARAELLQSPGRKPWVSHSYTSIEPQRGGTTPTADARAESAAPTELLFFMYVFTQGCISGFALITPWALKKCRA